MRTETDIKTTATFYHCLKIVMDGGSFLSSDPVAKGRDLYAKMFPDSKYADIKCGRTKAEYVITHAVAPCFRDELCENVGLSTKYGIHLDESTYKCTMTMFDSNFISVSSVNLVKELRDI